MRKTPGWIACFSLLALIGAMAVSCTPKSHQEQVAEMRAKYAADLNGFVIKSEPAATAETPPPPAAAPGGEDEDGGGAPTRRPPPAPPGRSTTPSRSCRSPPTWCSTS